MNPVQKKTDIRSTTLFGLSVINVMFEDKVDDFFARQQVYNLLNDADLPEGVTPEVTALTMVRALRDRSANTLRSE